VGKQVKAGDEFGEVESVKAVSPLYSPVSGEVIAVNEDLPNRLETLGSDPYGQGWVLKLRPTDRGEMERLLDFAAYSRQCAEGGH
jgi:glycine cleavage system H protein